VLDPARDEPADEALVARVCERDTAAFGTLYDRYAPAVYALAARLLGRAEAEEVVQDAFLRLWQRAAQYDATRSAFGAWFMAIARHAALDRLRRLDQGRRMAVLGDVERVLAAAPDPALDPQTAVWLNEEARAVRRALADLPEEQRRVLVLGYFGGLSQTAMADRLGWPLGTVKKRVRLGLQKLRRALGGKEAGVAMEADEALESPAGRPRRETAGTAMKRAPEPVGAERGGRRDG